MIDFDGKKRERKDDSEAEGVMDDGWDFRSTKKEDILTTNQRGTSQVKLTREIRVCEVSGETLQKN
jgi:hypothetical protein